MHIRTVRRRLVLLAVLFALIGSVRISYADAVGRGAGVVRDSSGAAIPNAKVTLTRTSTNATVVRTSDAQGGYKFLELAPDTYTVTVEAPGFKRTTLTQVIIQVDQESNLNVTLQLGEISESVSVDTGAPLVDTQQNTLSNVIDPQTISTAPLNSRNFLDLALLTPGATPSAGGSQVTGFNVAGARTQSNDYLIDGISNMDTQINSGLTSFRINDAVQEFSVQTSVPTAEFGRGEGAQINAVIKSGSNQFHGSAFEYFRNTILDATDYFSKHTAGGVKPVLNRNQFGATFGGPIFRNKTFFFLSYEGFRQVAPTVSAVLVPTPAQIASVTDPISKALLAYFPASQQPAINWRRMDELSIKCAERVERRYGAGADRPYAVAERHDCGPLHLVQRAGDQRGADAAFGWQYERAAAAIGVSGREPYVFTGAAEYVSVRLLVQPDELCGAGCGV